MSPSNQSTPSHSQIQGSKLSPGGRGINQADVCCCIGDVGDKIWPFSLAITGLGWQIECFSHDEYNSIIISWASQVILLLYAFQCDQCQIRVKPTLTQRSIMASASNFHFGREKCNYVNVGGAPATAISPLFTIHDRVTEHKQSNHIIILRMLLMIRLY